MREKKVVESVKLFDTSRLQNMQEFKSHINSVCLNSDGTQIVVGTLDGVRVWDIQTARCIYSLSRSHTSIVKLSPDNTQLAIKFLFGIDIVDVPTGKVKSLACEGEIESMSFSSDGSRLLVGFFDGSVKSFNIVTGICEYTVSAKKELTFSV